MKAEPKKSIFILIILFLFVSHNLLAADEDQPEPIPPAPTVKHILGDQTMIFSLGPFIPLFFVKTADGGAEATNLYVGAKASIEYMNYLSANFALGGEIIGGMAFSPNFNIYWTLPITFKGSLILSFGEAQLFIDLGLGINLQSFIGKSRVDFIIRPQLAFYLPIDPILDLGVAVGYWFVPQMATAEQEANAAGQSRLGNFLDVAISLTYHF